MVSYLSKLLFISLFLGVIGQELFAESMFEFSKGDKVTVISDKHFRDSQKNVVEAIGNVIITHHDQSLYGEKASMNLLSGDVDVVGNVRFISPDMTIYGSKLYHNIHNNLIRVTNARILTEEYIVLGKEISKYSDTNITAKEAEYTTCRDCPESWTIHGKDINITIGQYVRITHAFLKINGIVVMYIPYIIFPIKKKRETGFLFPRLALSGEDGVRFQTPFFMNLASNYDATITPSFFGKRGLGNELEYRHTLGQKRWFNINSLQAYDQVWSPEHQASGPGGDPNFRNFYFYEHHYAFSNDITNHLFYSHASDLDLYNDFKRFADGSIRESDLGLESHLDYRSNRFYGSIYSSWKTNMIVDDPEKFDASYVQILPEINVNMIPTPIIQSDLPLLRSVLVGANFQLSNFKQDHVDEELFLRNVTRLNYGPYLSWSLGQLGPITFDSKIQWSQQRYYLNTLEEDNRFAKGGLQYETRAFFDIDKVFGKSYLIEKPFDIEVPEDEQKDQDIELEKSYPGLIGKLPDLQSKFSDNRVMISQSSYKHHQHYELKHYYLSDQTISGNKAFASQLENARGRFDFNDIILANPQTLSQLVFKKSMPTSNTLEFIWNNDLIKKSARDVDPFQNGIRLIDSFDYSTVATFNLSQGWDFTVEDDDIRKKLTRLYLGASLILPKNRLKFNEYYFYENNSHLFSVSNTTYFSRGSLTAAYSVDTTSTTGIPLEKLLSFSGSLQVIDTIAISGVYRYDLLLDELKSTEVYGMYSPMNNCWKFQLGMVIPEADKENPEFLFNLLINYNNNTFVEF